MVSCFHAVLCRFRDWTELSVCAPFRYFTYFIYAVLPLSTYHTMQSACPCYHLTVLGAPPFYAYHWCNLSCPAHPCSLSRKSHSLWCGLTLQEKGHGMVVFVPAVAVRWKPRVHFLTAVTLLPALVSDVGFQISLHAHLHACKFYCLAKSM